MAASSPYSSTEETTNANRACRLLLGPCTDGLRDVLRHHVPPQTLTQVLKVNKQNPPRLTPAQKNLILHGYGIYTGNYDDMDITLLYTLLRNICNIPPHSNGWGFDPDPNDRSLSANIDRIRSARNQCVHSSSPSLSNTDFIPLWSTIRSAVVDLDTFLNNGKKYEKEVDFLRNETMDPACEKYYGEQLKKQVEEDIETREMVIRLGEKMAKIASPVPQSVIEQYDMEIKDWKDVDSFYHETHSFSSMMEKVRSHPYVTFVGGPGSGKSATAHHIALKLLEEGYEVLPIKEVWQRELYADIHNPQVFVIDDVVGVFGMQETKLNFLRDYKQKITQPCMANSKTLMTCREVVYNETLSYKSYFTNDKNVIKLHSSENDKKLILEKYGLDRELLSPSLLKSTSHMFPLLCKLFSKEEKFKSLGARFFSSPVPCILDDLEEMQRHKVLNYASLVLCVMNDGVILENDLRNSVIKCKDVLETLKIDSTNGILKAISTLKGTYTKQCGSSQYTFIHDSMYEISAYHYGQQYPSKVLLYMNSNYVANYVKPQKCELEIVKQSEEAEVCSHLNENLETSDGTEYEFRENDDEGNEREESFDLCIRLREDQYPLLVKRLYNDIEEMKLYDVFKNDALKHPQVCKALFDLLNEKRYTDIKSLFLHKQGNAHDIMRKHQRESTDYSNKHFDLLEDCRYTLWGNLTYSVRVISWVIYYGHHKILQYIMEQTQQHREIQTEIFYNNNLRFLLSCFLFGIRSCLLFDKKREEKRLFLLGCYSGDPETLKVLLQHVSIETITVPHPEFDNSPLTAVCEGGSLSMVEELLKTTSDVNLEDQWDKTPLIAACQGGHVSTVEKLLEMGANVNLETSLFTPLMTACEAGNVSVMEKLLEARVDVNLPHRRYTPLLAACKRGHVNIVEKLLKVGANVNMQENNVLDYYLPDLNISDDHGAHCTISGDGLPIVLFFTLIQNKRDVMKLLIRKENRMTLNKGNFHLFDILCEIKHAEVRIDFYDDVVIGERRVWNLKYRGFLWEQIRKAECDEIRHLLCVGMQVNQWIQLVSPIEKHEVRPLLYTLIDGLFVENRVEKIRILLEAGADVNVLVKYREERLMFGFKTSAFTLCIKNHKKYNSVLDKEGISALERARKIMCVWSKIKDIVLRRMMVSEYKRVMCEIKKHVRRYSV